MTAIDDYHAAVKGLYERAGAPSFHQLASRRPEEFTWTTAEAVITNRRFVGWHQARRVITALAELADEPSAVEAIRAGTTEAEAAGAATANNAIRLRSTSDRRTESEWSCDFRATRQFDHT